MTLIWKRIETSTKDMYLNDRWHSTAAAGQSSKLQASFKQAASPPQITACLPACLPARVKALPEPAEGRRQSNLILLHIIVIIGIH